MTTCPPKVDLNRKHQSSNQRNSNQKRSAEAHNDYRSLLGEDAWARLHPAIQKRFSHCVGDAVTYQGVMQHVQLSFAGKLLAQACRLIGTPLALYAEDNVPMTVNVYPDAKHKGMTWDRFYHYQNKRTNRVTSTKCILKEEGLVELVGFGFGMKLNVTEQNRAMIFESTEFFFKLGKLKMRIPDWMTPGKTVVSQRAIDDERFEFRLDVTHKWLGKVFFQVGTFKPSNQKSGDVSDE